MQEKLKLSNKNDQKIIADYLREGKVGVLPTDTLFGICSRMDDITAVERIFEIKKREKEKPFLVLSDSIERVERYLEPISEKIKQDILEKYWPGGLTVILPCIEKNVPFVVRAGGQTLGVRIPDNEFLLSVIERVGVPIVAPSANISGDFPPSRLDEVDKEIIDRVDFVVKGECKMKIASTILDCSIGNCRVLRQGAVDVNL